MMNFKHILIYCLSLISVEALAQTQKPAIDTSVYDKWPSVGASAAISNNGKYALYTIENEPVGSRTLVLQATDASWKNTVIGANDALYAQFTQDSKYALFTNPSDSLGIAALGSDRIEYIPAVSSHKLISAEKGEWLAYQQNGTENELIVRNLRTGKKINFQHVKNYWASTDGNVMVLQTETLNNGTRTMELLWTDPENKATASIWSATRENTQVQDITFDTKGRQLAFTVEKKTANAQGQEKAIWHYKAGNPKAIELLTNSSVGIDPKLQIDMISTGFSKDGNKLFFNLKERVPLLPEHNEKPVPLNIWSYKDIKLNGQEKDKIFAPQSYLSAIDIKSKQVIQLEQKDDHCVAIKDNLIIIKHAVDSVAINEGIKKHSYYATISLKNGQRVTLKNFKTNWNADFSMKKYHIYFDEDDKNYYSYELATGITRNITKDIQTNWLNIYRNDLPNASTRGIAGWTADENTILIYDAYDIWLVDPMGVKSPVNLTNGYGKQDHVIFYLSERLYANKIIDDAHNIILTAFNLDNKENGFFSISISKIKNPEKLTMGSFIYEATHNPYIDGLNSYRFDYPPIKASHAQMYIVRRMSATASPNYFSTKDFRSFVQLSDLAPEKKYNWYTTELHTWKSQDGRDLQGILFKPENFDTTKKYPVIFRYYERLSDALNAYIKPQSLTGGCTLNIPSYVSNEYLVFVPDIYYKVGDPMQGTYDAVVSGVNYISNLPFVDKSKIGAQGCSWGGYQTNYLVTHTNIFTAVCSASGVADLVSGYGMLMGDDPAQNMFESGQIRMGKSLCEIPDQYIKNSAIFSVDRVKTPILFMHTTNDGRCLIPNIWEFFTGLRHLGKKTWMLEYTEGNHGVSGISAKDFNARMMQFFDYYLKDKPAPQWMTDDVDVRLKKGLNEGLQPDTTAGKP